jgi:hypothetical protein
MTKRTDDPIVSRRRLIAREAVLFPGDTPLRDVIAAQALKGLDVLDRPIDALANDVSENYRAFTTGHENIMRFSCLGRPTAEID